MVGIIDVARTEFRTSPARDFRAAGKFPAHHKPTSRSSRVRIRPIRPHTATSSTVSTRSRAATTAIAACSPERREEKLTISKSNIWRTLSQDYFPLKFLLKAELFFV